MAIDLPAKKYYTFIELATRLQCSEQDLRHLVIEKEITPSYFLDSGFYADFQVSSNEDQDGLNLWPSEVVNWESKTDDSSCRTQLAGFHYLIFPVRVSATSCEFNYASKNSCGQDEGDICYGLEESYGLDYVLKSGVVMAGELARFEALHSKNDASTQVDKPLGTTERNNLLKLVIGMAVKGYNHDPAAKKSSTPKEIVDDLAELGISIDPDTVRKYLKESANTVLPAKPRQS